MAHTLTALISEAKASARKGRLPATMGVAGASLGLVALGPFLAPASVPMSALGLVLARRSGDLIALNLGGLGIMMAMSVLIRSDAAQGFLVAIAGGLGLS